MRKQKMIAMRAIREAMLRLSCLGHIPCKYDPESEIVGEGPIHYLVELGNLLFIAWENNDTGAMVVNPITRFGLDELDELGAAEAWTVMRVPADLAEAIQFREIDNVELNETYRQMAGRAIAAPALPAMCVP
jgi:antitoxin component of MazEF toxin-antitoxin module